MVHCRLQPTAACLVCYGVELFEGHYWYGFVGKITKGLVPDLDHVCPTLIDGEIDGSPDLSFRRVYGECHRTRIAF